jgi:hypothetical protein
VELGLRDLRFGRDSLCRRCDAHDVAQRGSNAPELVRLAAEPFEERAELRRRRRLVVARQDPGGAPDDPHDREVRDPLAVRKTPTEEHRPVGARMLGDVLE